MEQQKDHFKHEVVLNKSATVYPPEPFPAEHFAIHGALGTRLSIAVASTFNVKGLNSCVR
jgi:hypothetical protein